ncbi:MAG: hypothetical protein WCJ56_04425 [bacterium]
MKGYTVKEMKAFENLRPETDVESNIDFCLNLLYKDNKHSTSDDVVAGLTFEELLGTLLQARDLCEWKRRREETSTEEKEGDL